MIRIFFEVVVVYFFRENHLFHENFEIVVVVLENEWIHMEAKKLVCWIQTKLIHNFWFQ